MLFSPLKYFLNTPLAGGLSFYEHVCYCGLARLSMTRSASGAQTRLQISRLSILTCARFLGRDDAVSSCSKETRTKGGRRSSAAHLHMRMRNDQVGGNIRLRIGSLFKLGTQSPPESTEMHEDKAVCSSVFCSCVLNEQFFPFPHTRLVHQ